MEESAKYNDDIYQEEEDEAQGEEEGDDGEIVNDFEEDDDDDDEEGDEGIAVSNFVWQACYPAKLNQSFSMEVIEEESENEDQEVGYNQYHSFQSELSFPLISKRTKK